MISKSKLHRDVGIEAGYFETRGTRITAKPAASFEPPRISIKKPFHSKALVKAFLARAAAAARAAVTAHLTEVRAGMGPSPSAGG